MTNLLKVIHRNGMRLIRAFRCTMNIGHRVTEKWMTTAEAKLSPFQAATWECTIKDGKVNYFECCDCKAKMPPWEQRMRSYSLAPRSVHGT